MALLVREKQLPELLNLSRATIRRLMAVGKFPPVIKINDCCCWRRQEIETWIANGCGRWEGN